MSLYFGSDIDLEGLIKSHLFIICANHSGTTFLRDALATSNRTWNLVREGLHTFGFAGPSENNLKAAKRWASNYHWIDIFGDPDNYDWPTIKKSWYFQAFSRSETGRIFVEKSPPFLLIVDQLVEHFENARFPFMVRNPYSVVEGIRRRSPLRWGDSVRKEDVLEVASMNVVNCMKYQRNNIERWGDRSVFFSYEQMCGEPEKVQDLICGLVPDIDDLILRQRLPVKQYDE